MSDALDAFQYSQRRAELVDALQHFFSLTRLGESLWQDHEKEGTNACKHLVGSVRRLLADTQDVARLAVQLEERNISFGPASSRDSGQPRSLTVQSGRSSPSAISSLSLTSRLSSSSLNSVDDGTGAYSSQSVSQLYERLLSAAELFLTQCKYGMAGLRNMSDIVSSLSQIARLCKRYIEQVRLVLDTAQRHDVRLDQHNLTQAYGPLPDRKTLRRDFSRRAASLHSDRPSSSTTLQLSDAQSRSTDSDLFSSSPRRRSWFSFRRRSTGFSPGRATSSTDSSHTRQSSSQAELAKSDHSGTTSEGEGDTFDRPSSSRSAPSSRNSSRRELSNGKRRSFRLPWKQASPSTSLPASVSGSESSVQALAYRPLQSSFLPAAAAESTQCKPPARHQGEDTQQTTNTSLNHSEWERGGSGSSTDSVGQTKQSIHSQHRLFHHAWAAPPRTLPDDRADKSSLSRPSAAGGDTSALGSRMSEVSLLQVDLQTSAVDYCSALSPHGQVLFSTSECVQRVMSVVRDAVACDDTAQMLLDRVLAVSAFRDSRVEVDWTKRDAYSILREWCVAHLAHRSQVAYLPAEPDHPGLAWEVDRRRTADGKSTRHDSEQLDLPQRSDKAAPPAPLRVMTIKHDEVAVQTEHRSLSGSPILYGFGDAVASEIDDIVDRHVDPVEGDVQEWAEQLGGVEDLYARQDRARGASANEELDDAIQPQEAENSPSHTCVRALWRCLMAHMEVTTGFVPDTDTLQDVPLRRLLAAAESSGSRDELVRELLPAEKLGVDLQTAVGGDQSTDSWADRGVEADGARRAILSNDPVGFQESSPSPTKHSPLGQSLKNNSDRRSLCILL